MIYEDQNAISSSKTVKPIKMYQEWIFFIENGLMVTPIAKHTPCTYQSVLRWLFSVE